MSELCSLNMAVPASFPIQLPSQHKIMKYGVDQPLNIDPTAFQST